MDNTKNTKNTKNTNTTDNTENTNTKNAKNAKTANNFFMSSYKGRGRTAPPFISINAPSCPDTPPV